MTDMDEEGFQSQRLSFGVVAHAYDQVRPSYPAEALRWALGEGSARVVDLGAGTGLLTEVLVRSGHQVTAVEPDPGMSARLAVRLPDAVVVEGSAEAIPLPDGSADAVTAGQAYHWFDPEAAHAEIARVLRPGGVFAPVWNLRDESVDWVARMSELVGIDRDGSTGGKQLAPDQFGDAFGVVERRDFHYSQPHTADSLLALVQSRSWYLTASEGRRAELRAAIHSLTVDLPSSFELPYVSRVYRAVRIPS
jgi:SAM-dependent methyltransferase